MQFPQAEIVAFEPDNFNFQLLKKNIESYGFKNIELRKEAVWIENTRLNFLNNGSHSSRITDDADKTGTEIKAIRLKDILKENIDFLKLDIEGAEYKVILDIQDKLHLIKNIFIEYHGKFNQNKQLNEILNILTTNGFDYYIKEATNKHHTPFFRNPSSDYDVQLNIFGFRTI
jgi:FkbM family methyltransferase